jgi:hypothetical protein
LASQRLTEKKERDIYLKGKKKRKWRTKMGKSGKKTGATEEETRDTNKNDKKEKFNDLVHSTGSWVEIHISR